MEVPREEMLMKLGAARARAPTAWRLIDIAMDEAGAGFSYALNRQKLRQIRRREGRYLLLRTLRERPRAAVAVLYPTRCKSRCSVDCSPACEHDHGV